MLARMHKQRKVHRARDKVRFTKQKVIGRGGKYVKPTAPAASTATVTGLIPAAGAATGSYLASLTVNGTGFVAGTQVVYRKSGVTEWTTASQTTFNSATQVVTAWFSPSSAGVWQVAVRKPGQVESGSQNFTAT